jgi:hypothetical protein
MKRISKVALFLLSLTLVCFLVSVSYSHAAPPKAVMGYIEEVTSSTIKVKGQSYDISGIPLYHVNGAKVTRDLLQKGNAVEILFRDGKIVKITINNAKFAQ